MSLLLNSGEVTRRSLAASFANRSNTMIGKAIATAVIGVFLLSATAAFGQIGGAPGVGAPMETLMPSPPRNVTATAGQGAATVSFYPPKMSSSPVRVYTVTAYPGRIMVQGYKSPITVGGLTSGQTYVFTVTATSSIGTGLASEPSNPVTVP